MNKIIYLLLMGMASITITGAMTQNSKVQPSMLKNAFPFIKNAKSSTSHVLGQFKVAALQNNQNINQVQIDSIYKLSWDSISQNWNLNAKIISNYDFQNTEKERITKLISNDNSWENYIKTTFEYGIQDTIELNMLWINGEWQKYWQKTLSYDNFNNKISTINKQWDPVLSDWVINNIQIFSSFDNNKNEISTTTEIWMGGILFSSSKIINTYFDNNSPKSSVTEEWNYLTGVWQKTDSTSYDYDIQNSSSTETYLIKGENGWNFETENEYYYDTNNQLIRILMKQWDGIAWVNTSQYNQIVWGNSLEMPLSYTLQNWINNEWQDQSRVSNSFNAFKNVTSALMENWTGESWVMNSKSTTNYDANNQKMGESYQAWNQEGDKIVYGDSTTYFIHTINTKYHQSEMVEGGIGLYLVPDKSGYILSSSKQDIRSIEIMNSSGQTVYANFNIDQPSYFIQISNLIRGIYILKIKHGMNVSTQKIICNG